LAERHVLEGRSTSLVSVRSFRALNTCGNQLRFKQRVSYCAIRNMHRCATSPSATGYASSSGKALVPIANERRSH